MKKLFTILFLLISVNAFATPPSRVSSYVPLTTITSSAVTSNEDAIFNYLQAGVDTYSDNTIVNADIHTSAAISNSKLNLATISQTVDFSGSLTASGTLDLSGATITPAFTVANITATTADINGGTIDGATLGGSASVTITTADINGGTLDGVQIGGTSATGELIVNDSSDDADGLGSQGTSGQVLTSAGSGANPTWTTLASAGYEETQVGTFSATENGNIVTITDTLGTSNAARLIFTMIDGANDTYSPAIKFNSDATTYATTWYGMEDGTAAGAHSSTTSYIPILGEENNASAGGTAYVVADIIVQGSVTYVLWQSYEFDGTNYIALNGASKYDSTVTSINIYNGSANANNAVTGTYKYYRSGS